ncbi:Uridine nucleosidase 1 [Thelohanellus kitauei]|uniref:Uridine nucleosidase 1 n=1 Tax=Thelohanellus kitauei TaxID=669202 RepID=A0A0C2N1J6_THEKT|nr:Uridine nucleosidase 1 [Thelohanellus kitauei]
MKVIIDTDFGVSDTFSVLYLAAATRAEVMAITLVAGVGQTEIITQNIETIKSLIEQHSIPIYLGNSYNMQGRFMEGSEYFVPRPIEEIKHEEQWENVRRDISSVQALLHYTKMYPKQIHGIFIGPLTNLALAYMMDNEFPSRLASITIMGSDSSEKTTKNVSKHAEINAFNDPLAYSVLKECISKTNIPITIVDWTACIKNPLPFSLEEKIKEYNQMLSKINRYLNLFDMFFDRTNVDTKQIYHSNGLVIPGLFAVMGVIYPNIFKTKKVKITSVEVSGKRKGHVDYEEHPQGNLDLVYEVDAKFVAETFVATFFKWDILQKHFLMDYIKYDKL